MKKGIGAWVSLLVLMLLLGSKNGVAVDYLDGFHCPDGFYFVEYPVWYSADRLMDADGHTSVDHLGLNKYASITRGIYYSGPLAFNVIVPAGYLKIDALGDSDSGLGDSIVGAGYFLPVNWAAILPVVQLKLPTGSFHSGSKVNFGDGQMDVRAELYMNKFIGKASVDVAFRYWLRLENSDISWKPGDEFYAETVVTYPLTSKIRLGPDLLCCFGRDGEQDGLTVADSAVSSVSAGGQLIYQANNVQFMLDCTIDLSARNAPEGRLVKGRICIPL